MQDSWPPAPLKQPPPPAEAVTGTRKGIVAAVSLYFACLGSGIIVLTHIVDYTGLFCNSDGVWKYQITSLDARIRDEFFYVGSFLVIGYALAGIGLLLALLTRRSRLGRIGLATAVSLFVLGTLLRFGEPLVIPPLSTLASWVISFLNLRQGGFRFNFQDRQTKPTDLPLISEESPMFRNIIFCILLLCSLLPKSIDAAPIPQETTSGIAADSYSLITMTDAIRTASEIRFYQADTSSTWFNIPFAVLSEQSHPHMFHLMKATQCRRKAGYSRFTHYIVAFFAHGKLLSKVGYYPDLGWLVEPHWQNGQLSEELRKWIATLIVQPKPVTFDSTQSRWLTASFQLSNDFQPETRVYQGFCIPGAASDPTNYQQEIAFDRLCQ